MNDTSLNDDPRITGRLATYGHAGEVALELEVYTPSEPGQNRPGVLFVHGGGWGGGNRGQFRWHAKELAIKGFVAATASYRLTGVATYPAQLDDCQRAMRWLRKHANELGLDPARLGAMGSSAGGHLVACLGVRETRDDSDESLRGFSSKAAAVVDVHGVHDLPALIIQGMLAESSTKLCGGPIGEKRELWEDASPQRFVDATSAPMFILHDPGDPTVPYVQSVSFAHALMAATRPVVFLPTPGSGHGYVYGPQNPWTQRVWPDIVAWLTRQLA